MKNNILFVFFLFSKILFACECPNLQPISKELCNNYNVIFWGKVDSVASGNKIEMSKAYFTISKLYKGSVLQHIKVNFNGSSACMMGFSKNEEWLMYCTFQRFDELTVNICGHSRKFFNDAAKDFYQVAAQRTFEEEKEFLQTTLAIQPYAQNNELDQQQTDLKPHNDQPSGMNKLLLLLISFIAMLIVYFVTRNKNKNDK